MISFSNVFQRYLSHLENSFANLCRTKTPFCLCDHLFYKDFVLDSWLNIENVIDQGPFFFSCLISNARYIAEGLYKLILRILVIEVLKLSTFDCYHCHSPEHFLQHWLPVFVLWSDEIKLLWAAVLEQIKELGRFLLRLFHVMAVK